ncbi:MAG: phosphoribosyl-ATP diphosphatase [Alphaproteobacteria bacterium]
MDSRILDVLFEKLKERAKENPDTSYTAKLLRDGTEKIAKKVVEEAGEVIIEAMKGDKKALVNESVDLLYHLLVLCLDAGIELPELWEEAARRQGISGIEEKASRT